MRISRNGTSSRPSVTFWGAAQSVTGSMHLVEWGGERILLDCGLVLGWGAEAQRRNRLFPFVPASLTAVILSHAHIDHCGNLPNLVRQGFAGPIYCTPATLDLLAIMLADSARIQQADAHIAAVAGLPEEGTTGALYNGEEVRRTLTQCITIPYEEIHELRPGVQLRFVDAGHLLGSAMVALTFGTLGKESRITFTGDLGRHDLGFLKAPSPVPAADLIICESTYGGRSHQSLQALSEKLKQVVRNTIDRGGKVLIPAFSLGRAQIVVHYLRRWMMHDQLPSVPIYIDSPLAADIAEVYDFYPESLENETLEHERPMTEGNHRQSYHTSGVESAESPPGEAIRSSNGSNGTACLLPKAAPVRYVRGHGESKALSRRNEPCILVASGGMCEAGRILNHFEHNLDDPRNTVALVSYQAPGSLGRKLMDRGPTVSFRGRRWNKWADIVDLNGFSGHADQDDFRRFFEPLVGESTMVRLVHGELQQAEALASSLRKQGFADVCIPRREETVQV